MDLSSKLVKDFAKQIVEAQNEKETPVVQLLGTVSVSGGNTYVILDGSGGNLTPVSNTVDYSNGDRVLVTIQNRTATIIGNYTEPSINEALENVTVEYALSSSDSEFIAWPGEKGRWSTTAPSRENGSYMWQRTTKVSTSGGTPTVSMTCIQGADGEGGQGVFKSIVFKRSSSTPDIPTGGSYSSPVPSGWSDGVPTGNDQLWMSTRIFTSDGQSPQTSAWTTPSKASDTVDIEFQYSSVANTPGNPTENPSNWSSSASSSSIWMAIRKKNGNVWGSWEVSKIKGEKGDEGDPGSNGYNTAMVYLYKRSASQPTIDWSQTLTYNFSNKALTSIPSGWSATIPSGNNPVYVTAATAFSNTNTDDISSSEWARPPVKLAENGTSVTVYSVKYQEGTSPTSKPTGEWSDNPVTVAEGKYLWTKTTFSDNSEAYCVSKQGVSGQPGDTPTIGADKYWYISGVKTNVKAEGKDGDPGTPIVWKGSSASAPANPQVDWCYRNTTDGKVYIYNGSSWVLMTQDGEEGDPGDPGLNSATVYLYKRASSAPSKPSVPLVYTFATGILSQDSYGITDLTGTNWIIDEHPDVSEWMPEYDEWGNINFTTYDVEFVECESIAIVPEDSGRAAPYLEYNPIHQSGVIYAYEIDSWNDDGYRTIEITGGEHCDNTTARGRAIIAWLEDNATLVPDTLANTYWIINDTPDMSNYLGEKNVNFYYGADYSLESTIFEVGYQNHSLYYYIGDDEWLQVYRDTRANPWSPESAKYVHFIDGTDIDDSSLINWLCKNATQITMLPGGWKQSISELSGTDPIYVITATAIANTATDTIAASEWSNPSIMSQNGDKGADGTDGKMLYGTSSTAAATQIKETYFNSVKSLYSGLTISVRFTNANTASNPKLKFYYNNGSSYSIKEIYTNGVNAAYWEAGQTVIFTYSGSYWYVCSSPVYASTATIGNPASKNIYIDENAINIKNVNTELATFGANAIELGKNSNDAIIRMCNNKPYIKGEFDSESSSIGLNFGFNGFSSYAKSMYISTMSEDEWARYQDDGVDVPYASLNLRKDYASGEDHCYPTATIHAYNGWAGAGFSVYPTYDGNTETDIGMAVVVADQFMYNDYYLMSTPVGPNRKIAWGTKNITLSGTTLKSATVTFSDPFSGTPYIFACCNSGSRVSAGADDITSDGFKLTAWGLTSAIEGSKVIRWLAVGKA